MSSNSTNNDTGDIDLEEETLDTEGGIIMTRFDRLLGVFNPNSNKGKDDELDGVDPEEKARISEKGGGDAYAAYREYFTPEQDEFLREFTMMMITQIGGCLPEEFPSDEFLKTIKDPFVKRHINYHKLWNVFENWPYFVQPRQVSRTESILIRDYRDHGYSMAQLAWIFQRSSATIQKHVKIPLENHHRETE